MIFENVRLFLLYVYILLLIIQEISKMNTSDIIRGHNCISPIFVLNHCSY